MKKIIVLLLTFTMLLYVFCSCVEDKPEPNDTKPANESGSDVTSAEDITTAEPEAVIDIPDVKYTGYDFNVLIQTEMCDDFVCTETETGDPINDAVLRKNRAIEELFGITITVESVTFTQATTQFKNVVRSGADDYDIGLIHLIDGASLALDGTLLPFEKLEYIDLSKPWWDKNLKEGYSIKNNLLMANGDISPESFSITSCMFFNKSLFDKYDMEYPYELVKEGKWTLDALYEMTKGKTTGLDDNDESNDMYGLISWWLDVPYSLYYGSGGKYITKNSDDYPEINLDKEKDLAIVEKMNRIINGNKAMYVTVLDDFPTVGLSFADGKGFFYDAKLQSVEFLREMEDNFGFLPIPKYDEQQTDYLSFINGCTSMLMIPSTCSDPERTSIIVEALAYESYKNVTPALYETYLKRKMAQDVESTEMIDYIVRNRVFDMGYAYFYDGISLVIRDLMKNNSTDIVSQYSRLEKTARRTLEKLIDKFDESLEE